jgi:hypothetical protein
VYVKANNEGEKSGLYCVRGPRINEHLFLDIKLQEPSRLENHHNV